MLLFCFIYSTQPHKLIINVLYVIPIYGFECDVDK